MPNHKQSIRETLLQFYERPVAAVSVELIFSLFAVIFLILLAIRPTLVTISDLIKEIDDKKQLNQLLSQKVAALSTVQGTFQDNQQQLLVLDEALPPSPRLGEALQVLEQLASENGVSVVSLDVKEVPPETMVENSLYQERKNLLLHLNVSGEFTALHQFIETLRSVRRLFVVDSITFSFSESSGKKQLQALLNINLQYFVQASPPPEVSPEDAPGDPAAASGDSAKSGESSTSPGEQVSAAQPGSVTLGGSP